MPELPEVESARQVIERMAIGRPIADVDDSDTYECRPHPPGEIQDALVGRSLTAAHRRGKLIWCETSGRDDPVLSIHLGMSGRILVTGPDDEALDEGGDRPRSTRARKEVWFRFSLQFEDGGRLRLLDPVDWGGSGSTRIWARWDPTPGEIDRAEFRSRVGRGTAPLKARLLDQATLAGVGNLLADEVLWQSRLDPRRPAGELAEEELDELRRQLRKAIRSAMRHGGVHTGEIIEHRARGGHCPRCGADLERATVGSRTTWWCPREQA